MRILAVETATQPGSIALLDGGRLLSEARLPTDRRTTQSLFLTIESELRRAEWQTSDVQLVAVAQGPGSFTGLRIGVTLAKTWAYASQCDVLGLPTLDVVAAQAETDRDQLWAVLDAQRNQLFAAQYQRLEHDWQLVGEVQIVDRRPWWQQVSAEWAVTGEGLRGVLEHGAAVTNGCHVVSRELWTPWAATLGRLAERRFAAGARSDLWSLRPYYCRKSAAEEKAEQKSP